MSIRVESWLTDALYSTLYTRLRRQFFGKRELGKKTIHKLMQENLTVLNERERYFLRLYAVHGENVRHVAKDADVTYKRARRTLDIAIRKMMSPECLVHAKVIPEFKHTGDSLTDSRVMRTQTVKRLAQYGIESDGDLLFWYNLGPQFLFRIPEVAEGRIVEILSHLNDKKLI